MLFLYSFLIVILFFFFVFLLIYFLPPLLDLIQHPHNHFLHSLLFMRQLTCLLLLLSLLKLNQSLHISQLLTCNSSLSCRMPLNSHPHMILMMKISIIVGKNLLQKYLFSVIFGILAEKLLY